MDNHVPVTRSTKSLLVSYMRVRPLPPSRSTTEAQRFGQLLEINDDGSDVVTIVLLLAPPHEGRLGNQEARRGGRGLPSVVEAADKLHHLLRRQEFPHTV